MNLAKKMSSLLIYVYFLLFLLNSIVPPFAEIYSEYALGIESILMVIIFALNIKVVLRDKIVKWASLILLAFVLFSIVLTGGGIGGFLNMVRFLAGIMIFSSISLGKKGKRRLGLLCLIIWVFNLALAPTAWSLYEARKELYNPNMVGTMIFYTSALLIFFIKRIGVKLLVFVVSIIAIMLTQCRSALGAELLYFAALYLPFLKSLFKHLRMYLPYAFAMFGTFFPKLYLNMYANNVSLDLTYSEKGLFTGRQVIWQLMLDSLNSDKVNYILGVGTKNVVENGKIISGYHNWYFGIIYVYGIPVFLLYFFVFIYSLRKIKSYEVFCIVLGIMLLGIFETTVLSGLVQTYVFMCFLLGGEKQRRSLESDSDIDLRGIEK